MSSRATPDVGLADILGFAERMHFGSAPAARAEYEALLGVVEATRGVEFTDQPGSEGASARLLSALGALGAARQQAEAIEPPAPRTVEETGERLRATQARGEPHFQVEAALLGDLLNLYDAFRPTGDSTRSDDPQCRWLRFLSVDASKLYAASARITEHGR